MSDHALERRFALSAQFLDKANEVFPTILELKLRISNFLRGKITKGIAIQVLQVTKEL